MVILRPRCREWHAFDELWDYGLDKDGVLLLFCKLGNLIARTMGVMDGGLWGEPVACALDMGLESSFRGCGNFLVYWSTFGIVKKPNSSIVAGLRLFELASML